MADFALSGEVISPSINNVGGGKKLNEAFLTAIFHALAGGSYVVYGFDVTEATTDGLTLNVPAGAAFINGRFVSISEPVAVVCTDDALNHIYLKIILDALGNATGAVIEVNTSELDPDYSTKLGTATAASGVITETTDRRTLHAMFDQSGMTVPRSATVVGDLSADGDVTATGNVSAGGDGSFANMNSSGEVNAATGNLTDLNVTNPITGSITGNAATADDADHATSADSATSAGDADTVGGQANTAFAESVATVNSKRAGYAVYAP